MKLEHKVVLIPGASRPIGRAIAKVFGDHGATLILPCFDWPESVQQMKEEFSSLNYTAHYHECDLREEAQVKELAEFTRKTCGTISYLINNIERGGMPIVHGSYDLPVNHEQWDLEIATTLKAKWLLYHYFSPLFNKNTDGAIVNISSISGLVGRSGPASQLFNDGYSAANQAISTLTRQWAKEMAPEIRVNEVMLGLIDSRHGKGTRGWQEMEESQKERLLRHTLMGRTGAPEEVAESVFFLACRAPFVTGATLRVDGGYLLGGEKIEPFPPGILETQ